MTGQEIDKEVVDGLLQTEEVEKKHFKTFLQDKLAEDKKSFFEPFCKARLITDNEEKEKLLKSLSVIKEVCHAFGLLPNRAIKFSEHSNILLR